MDTDAIAARGTESLRPLLDAVGALRDTRDLAAFLGEFERIGGHGVFGSYIDNDDKDSDRYLTNLYQGGLGLPDESYYRDDKFADKREAYVDYLTRLLDPRPPRGRPRGRRDDPRDRHPDRRRALGARRDPRRAEDLQPDDLRRARRRCARASTGTPTSRNLGGSRETIAEVCVRQPSFFAHLSTVLDEVPIEDWKAWLLSHVLRSAAAYLTDDFVETNFDFYGRTLNGTPELRARWKRGVGFVEGALGEAVGKEYVARHFPPTSKALMDELVADLLEAYRQSIEAARLDDRGDQGAGLRQARDVPAQDRLPREVPRLLRARRRPRRPARQRARRRRPSRPTASSPRSARRSTATSGSCCRRPSTPTTTPAPTRSASRPASCRSRSSPPTPLPAENYGGIGAVIGHEIGHGFDDQGAQYDGHGNLNDWWTPDDKAAFEVKSKALIEQYDAFEPRALPGEHVNGALTVGENIGDLGGLTIALKAFALNRARHGEEATREGRETLFLNWAYVWRTKRRTEQEQQYLTIDPHSPPEFRANIVRNLDEFHEVFGTAEGDGLWLDPSERVRIW